MTGKQRWLRQAVVLVVATAMNAVAVDMPCWRGPDGNGTVGDCGAPLVESAGEARLRWVQPRIKSRKNGKLEYNFVGFSSPIMGDGKVFLHRHLGDGKRINIGIYKRRARQHAPGDYAARMASAAAEEVIAAVDIASGEVLWERRFPGAMNYPDGWKFGIRTDGVFMDGRYYAMGTAGRVFCLDADTGALLWQSDIGLVSDRWQQEVRDYERTFCHRGLGRDRHCLQAAAFGDGVVVYGQVIDSPHCTFGFDGVTGQRLWRRSGGMGQVPGSSGVRCTVDGKTRLLIGRQILEFGSGRTVADDIPPAGGQASPCVSGEFLVTRNGERGRISTTGYRLTSSGAEQIWEIDWKRWIKEQGLKPHGLGTTPVATAKHVFLKLGGPGISGAEAERRLPGIGPVEYYVGSVVVVCVELATGKVVGHRLTVDEGYDKGHCASAVCADGFLFNKAGPGVEMLTADAELRSLGLIDISELAADAYGMYIATTPLVADGYLVLLGNAALICVDLRKEPPPVTPSPYADLPRDAAGLAAACVGEDVARARAAADRLAAFSDLPPAERDRIREAAVDAAADRQWGRVEVMLDVLGRLDAGAEREAVEAGLAPALSDADADRVQRIVALLRGVGVSSPKLCESLLATAGDTDLPVWLRARCLRAIATAGAKASSLATALLDLALGDDRALAPAAARALANQQEEAPLSTADLVRVAKRVRDLAAIRNDGREVTEEEYQRDRQEAQLTMLLWEARPRDPEVLRVVRDALYQYGQYGYACHEAMQFARGILIAAGKAALPILKEPVENGDTRVVDKLVRTITDTRAEDVVTWGGTSYSGGWGYVPLSIMVGKKGGGTVEEMADELYAGKSVEELADDVRTGRSAVRVCALRALGRRGEAARPAMPAIVSACESSNMKVKKAAGIALVSVVDGLPPESTLEAVVLAMTVFDSKVGYAAADIFTAYREKAIPILVRTLKDGYNPFVRWRSAYALAKMGKIAVHALPEIESALARTDHEIEQRVMREAIQTLRDVETESK